MMRALSIRNAPLHQPQLHGEFHQPTLAFDVVLFEECAPVFLYGEETSTKNVLAVAGSDRATV